MASPSSPTEPQEFLGKAALVTGSSSGIGRAIAVTLARRGASVTLCGRDIAKLEAARQECEQASGGQADRFLTVSGDVTDSSHRQDLVDQTVAKFGRLDILVCNAGILSSNDRIATATEKMFDDNINILVKSVFFLIQAALPHLEKSKGNVVTISSVAAKMPSFSVTTYAMCKAAVDHMTRCIAFDLGPNGIRVNSVKPGLAITTLFRSEDGTVKEDRAAALTKINAPYHPFGGRLVTVPEIVDAVIFLASERAGFITGQNLMVDGGRTLNGPTLPTDGWAIPGTSSS